MAKYTTQIRSIVESGHPLFDFSYPIFDENYRNVLETKIINHYYFREIGLETVGQFKHFLKTRLNSIMPYYNQLYGTENLITKDDYMINLDNKTTRTIKTDTATTGTTDNTSDVTGQTDSTSTGSSTSSSTADHDATDTGRSVFSDTPQAKLQDLDYATNLTDTDTTSASSDSTTAEGEATETTGTTTTGAEVAKTISAGELTTTEEYTEHFLGNASMRYNADILMEWRKSFLNIDQLIIDELQDLFMNIY